MSRAANPLPPPSSRAPHPRPRRAVSFRCVFLGVLLAHLLVILGVAFFRLPEKKAAGKPGEQPIAMFTPMAAAAPPPAPTPTPTPPVPQPTPPTPTPPEPQPTPTPPEPTPPPTPDPTPEPVSQAPSAIVVPPKPAPTPTPVKPTPAPPKPEAPKVQTPPPAAPTKPATPTPAPAKPEKHVPKVNLNEVQRDSSPAPAKPAAHTAPGATGPGESPALKASDISHQLSNTLNNSSSSHVSIPGPVGQPGDNGDAEYYALIQRAMYGAWDQPTDLMGRHLVARIQVHISRDGTISDCTLAGSSGNAAFDQSALAAARRAGRLSKPRPDDIPETVAINFKLAD